jgi:AbrB family looped-hinge helix DNA binding protein
MEIAKITDKGQITIPNFIRKDLGLKMGDKVVFIKTKNGYLMADPTQSRLELLCKEFKGFAKEMNLKTIDDVVNLVKKTRKEIF